MCKPWPDRCVRVTVCEIWRMLTVFFLSHRLWCVQVALIESSMCRFQMLQPVGRFFLSSSVTCLWPKMCLLMTWWLKPTSILELRWVKFLWIIYRVTSAAGQKKKHQTSRYCHKTVSQTFSSKLKLKNSWYVLFRRLNNCWHTHTGLHCRVMLMCFSTMSVSCHALVISQQTGSNRTNSPLCDRFVSQHSSAAWFALSWSEKVLPSIH